ncbi:hypothetical protein OH77DRAFT_1490134 [Trametes cingulata]|nr:hypothetical protein OH77DRAFT_1490134 [Trametes cingulata]
MAAFINYGWLLGVVPQLLQQFPGTWSVTYDIYTRPTEDPVPRGWQSRRASTYREIIKLLTSRGFQQHQYSDYRCHDSSALNAYMTALELLAIRPPGKLPTTVRGLKIHHISDDNLMELTPHVRLGGNAAQGLAGPAPRTLVQSLVGAGHHLMPVPQPVPQGHPGVPPFATKRTEVTRNAANYVM